MLLAVDVWEPQYAPKGYNVQGGSAFPNTSSPFYVCVDSPMACIPLSVFSQELVYAVPNDADGRVMNGHSIEGNIALVDRGKVSNIAAQHFMYLNLCMYAKFDCISLLCLHI